MERIPPHNLEAEMALLGSILVDREILDVALDVVRPSDFYAHVHETIFAAFISLHEARKPIDKLALAESLRASGQLEKVGGAAYLSSLMDSVQTAASAKYYATIIREKAKLRGLIHAGTKITRLGFDGEDDVADTTDTCERLLREAIGVRASDDGKSAAQAAQMIYYEIDRAMNGEKKPGALTPFKVLDKHTGGFHPGEVIVIAGAPGQGKSVAGVQIAENVAVHVGPAIVFALEMGIADTVRRVIASRAGLNVRAMRRGDLVGKDFDRLGSAINTLSELPLWFYDAETPKTVSDIGRICRRHSDTHGLSMIVVDHPGYLADVIARGRMSKHESLEIAYLRLKQIASELKIPVVIIQHINRSGMDREPTLADLRDGGNLEGVAHIVIFPYRKDLINAPEIGDFIVAKNRDGEPGRIPMRFNGARFEWADAGALL